MNIYFNQDIDKYIYFIENLIMLMIVLRNSFLKNSCIWEPYLFLA